MAKPLRSVKRHPKDRHSSGLPLDPIRQLVSRPTRPYNRARPGRRDSALNYTLTITPSGDRISELKALVGEMPGFDLSYSGLTVLSVCHSKHWTSTGVKEAGIFGGSLTFIEDPVGGVTYCDHTDHLYFSADKSQVVPLAPLPPTPATIEVQPGELIEGRSTNVATVHVAGPPGVCLRIWFIQDSQLAQFASFVFARMVGCPDRLTKAGFPVADLQALGLPVRLESYLVVAGEPNHLLVTSTLTNLEIGVSDPALFAIPRGYHDLRDTKGLSKKVGPAGFRSGHAVRLSDILPGAFSRRANARPTVTTLNIMQPAMQEPNIPQCRPATLAAQIGGEVNQAFCDDLKFLINNVATRLGLFSGSNGTIIVDWLGQWSTSPGVMSGNDGLFCLMRDPADFTSTPPYLGGAGLLDKMAERQARSHVQDGSITSIGLPIPPVLLVQIINVQVLPPNQRFDALSLEAQAQLRELYLTQLIGQFTVTYPTSTSPTTTFYGLVNVQLSDIEFDININNTQPITTLDLGNNLINMHLALPAVRGNANIGRWPTGLYWAALGASGIACFFIPFLCSLAAAVAAVGVFLLSDYAYVRVEIDNCAVDVSVSFQPDAQNVLRPQATLTLNGDVSVWYMSYVPTGIQQLASFVYTLVGNHTNIVINAIQAQLQSSVNNLLTSTLDLSFPPHFGPVPFTGINSSTDGQTDDFLYLQAGLNAGLVGYSAPYITQVSPDVEATLISGRPASAPPQGPPIFRSYGGFALSQNIINYYINSIWRNGAYTYALSTNEAAQIGAMLAPLVNIGRQPLYIHIWPAVTPRTVLTPYGEYIQKTYAATFFDDVRLCISTSGKPNTPESDTLELQFAAEAFTQLGLGAVNQSLNPPKLDIVRVTDTFIDLYFDLSRLKVKLIHPEVESLQTNGGLFSVLTISSLPSLQPAMLLALQFALQSRDDQFIPSPPNDPLLQQYPIPGATIDFHLKPDKGNVYAWIGISGTTISFGGVQVPGLLACFPNGQFDISTIKCVVGTAIRNAVSP